MKEIMRKHKIIWNDECISFKNNVKIIFLDFDLAWPLEYNLIVKRNKNKLTN